MSNNERGAQGHQPEHGNLPTDSRPARPVSGIRFTEIPHVGELTAILGRSIDWDAIDASSPANRVFERFRANVQRTTDLSQGGVHGSLIEIHVQRLLKQVENSGEFPGAFQVSPIRSESTTDNFRFVKTVTGGYRFQKIMLSGKPHSHAEVDGLIEVNGVPVVVEVKAGISSREIKKSISEKRVQKIREALDEVYPGAGFGYILVAPSDIVAADSPVQQGFKDRGGVIIALGATTAAIDENVRRLATNRQIAFFNKPEI